MTCCFISQVADVPTAAAVAVVAIFVFATVVAAVGGCCCCYCCRYKDQPKSLQLQLSYFDSALAPSSLSFSSKPCYCCRLVAIDG